jgi:argininosuccinate lyase
VHTGRSRNDQVLVDLHLYMRASLQELLALTEALFEELMANAALHKDALMPGYTHLQVAMPSSFGLWFGAYAEQLIDDVHLLRAAYRVVDQNPLGSAAGYGTSIPINRQLTTDLLGFGTLKYNVVAAQMSRGKAEKTVSFALASLAGTLAKMAMDVCLYMSQNFAFFSLPKEFTTGSSIMPHKKNPDVFEIMRAKCNKIQALPYEITLITNNLPSGYHRDFQLLKEAFMPAVAQMRDCLQMAAFVAGKLQVNEDVLANPIYDYLYTVESVNEAVMQGASFREAYRQVGMQIEAGEYRPRTGLHHTHEGSIGNLCLAQIRAKMKQALNT